MSGKIYCLMPFQGEKFELSRRPNVDIRVPPEWLEKARARKYRDLAADGGIQRSHGCQ